MTQQLLKYKYDICFWTCKILTYVIYFIQECPTHIRMKHTEYIFRSWFVHLLRQNFLLLSECTLLSEKCMRMWKNADDSKTEPKWTRRQSHLSDVPGNTRYLLRLPFRKGFRIILSRDRVTVRGIRIDDRIYWTLSYSVWLYLCFIITQTNTHTLVSIRISIIRCWVAAPNGGDSPACLFGWILPNHYLATAIV
jgi:hypothetical protein